MDHDTFQQVAQAAATSQPSGDVSQSPMVLSVTALVTAIGMAIKGLIWKTPPLASPAPQPQTQPAPTLPANTISPICLEHAERLSSIETRLGSVDKRLEQADTKLDAVLAAVRKT